MAQVQVITVSLRGRLCFDACSKRGSNHLRQLLIGELCHDARLWKYGLGNGTDGPAGTRRSYSGSCGAGQIFVEVTVTKSLGHRVSEFLAFSYYSRLIDVSPLKLV